MPETGMAWVEAEREMTALTADDARWRQGRTPAYMFGATDEAKAIVEAAYMKFFSENALGARRAFPSVKRMEDEIVAMALDLFHAPEGRGTMTTGGTESILLAMKACRDWTRAKRGRSGPFNVVAPLSLHPGFDKAATLMDVAIRRTRLAADYRADAAAMAEAIDSDTMMLVGSAPCFPHGVIDPIEALGALARERGLWLHVDACVGGYFAPFAAELGYKIPPFDFAVPGVTSLSADLHKFGYAAKPASTVFYRDAERHRHQGFDCDAWSFGRFATETFAGTRPAGAVAAAWALMVCLGRSGYRAIAQRVMTMTAAYIAGIEAIPGLAVVGKPDLSIISFEGRGVDIRAVAAALGKRGWLVNMTKTPPAIHMMMSLLHEEARAQYLVDLHDAVAEARGGVPPASASAPTY